MTETSVKDGLAAMDVAAYLRENSEFLSDFPDLAMCLKVPREEGPAASLAGYQLEVLRANNQELKRRLGELIEIASENEQLMVRVHSLTLALMRAASRAETLRCVVANLTEDFHTDLVRVVLFGEHPYVPEAPWLHVEPEGGDALPAFAEFLDRGEPLCGRLAEDKLALLFAERSAEVRSAVLLQVDDIGMLAIGSQDPNRFHPGMGTVFLKLIAEALTAALRRFPDDDA